MASSSSKTDELNEFLTKYGLTDSKWSLMFRNMQITNPYNIEDKESKFQMLSMVATPSEKNILRKALGISNPVSIVEKVHGILEEVGLDVEYWAQVLEEQFGVITVQGMAHIDNLFYPHLVQYARSPKEKATLENLLKMEEDEMRFLEKYERHMRNFKTKETECNAVLFKMDQFRSEGRQFQDKEVQDLCIRVLECMHIPRQFWFTHGSFESFSDSIKTYYCTINDVLDRNKECVNSNVISDSSDGLALKGLFVQYDTEIHVDNRLLEIPGEVVLQEPFHFQYIKYVHCIDKNEENRILKENEVIKRDKQVEQNDTYCATLRYFVVPVASCFFSITQLQLSNNAIARLKFLEKCDRKSVQSECKKFLKDFGSHICLGPFHFGGRYMWHSYSCGIQQKDMNAARQLQGEVIKAHGCMSNPQTTPIESVDKVLGEENYRYSRELYQQTYIKVESIGGPKSITSVALWRNHIFADSTSWALIDIGAERVPVWEVIEKNHSHDFENTCSLAAKMKKVWEEMNSAPFKISKEQEIMSDIKELVSTVSGYIKDKSTNYIVCLSSLIIRKEEVFRREKKAFIWPMRYLSLPTVQNLIKITVDAYKEKCSTSSQEIKGLLRKVVTPVDLEIYRDFPHKGVILRWVYDTDEKHAIMNCSDLMFNLDLCFQAALEKIPNSTADKEFQANLFNSALRSTSVTEDTLSYIQCHLRRTKQTYDIIFIAILLFPFQHGMQKKIFLRSISEVQFLKQKFENHTKDYFKIKEQTNDIKLQAYLFLLTIGICKELEIVDSPRFAAHLECAFELMMPNLNCEIENVINKVISKSVKSEWAEIALQHIMQSSPSQKQDPSNMQSPKISVPRHAITLDPVKRVKICEGMMSILCVKELYPQSLTLQQALEVRLDKKRGEDEKYCYDRSVYAFQIIRKIMSFDHRCRLRLACSATQNFPENELKKLAPLASERNGQLSVNMNPMDGLLAVLLCADNNLRQDLMCRLATCQIAIPLLLPDPISDKLTFTLWAMRTIIKQWKTVPVKDKKVLTHELPITSYKAPIISFLRFGSHHRSKSHLMNVIINDSGHDTFFHYDCDGGSARKFLADGLVEVAWVFPSPTKTVFEDAVTFVNMHGDARSFPKQVKFLSEVSFMCLVFLNEEDLDDIGSKVLQTLSRVPGGIVLLRTRTVSGEQTWESKYRQLPSEVCKKCSILKLDEKNVADTKADIRKKVNNGIYNHWSETKQLAIEQCNTVAGNCDILVDEDDPECRNGKTFADNFKFFLTQNSNPKDHFVLQGDNLWHKMATLEKEMYRQKKIQEKSSTMSLTVSEYSEHLASEIATIRKDQLKHIRTLETNPLVATFVKTLLSCNGAVRNYYLRWLKMLLDNVSRETLPPLHKKYQETRLELQKAREKKVKGIEKYLTDMENLNIKLINASFGLEHLMRELCQIYEATRTKYSKTYEQLPRVAAELLIEGFPLELMDGDAGHVPIVWVSAVLEELERILNDPLILVLSILGLQSTGKSTLLNTVFGVNFSVSAGRCTRGAFMQLIKLHKSLKQEYKCEYILLVDTEGLRAPELDATQTHNHDNQLATFVIGLANLTVINIYGEIPADMNDILQTAVHAFLRMKEVTLLNPGCHFVHQNVTSIAASDKGMMGRSKVKANLDKMTKIAAEEEGLGDKYSSFNDVISYKEDSDVSYFPSLWVGDPPMAPVNPSYSIQALLLRSQLVRFSKQKQIKISELKAYLRKFWIAILRENFIFSFKNTLEMSVYSSLDSQRSIWYWSFRKDMMSWESDFETAICNLRENDEEVYKSEKERLTLNGNAKYSKLDEEMKKFFEESTDSEILVNWKGETERQLVRLHEDLNRRAMEFCEQVWKNKVAEAEINKIKESHHIVISEKVKMLVADLDKYMLTVPQLKDKFEEQWKVWITALERVQMKPKVRPIRQEVEDALKQHFGEKHLLTIVKRLNVVDGGKCLEEWGRGRGREEGLHLQVEERHITDSSGFFQGVKEKIKKLAGAREHWRNLAEKENEHYLEEVKKYLKAKQDKDYNDSFTAEILQMLQKEIDKMSSDTFTFSTEYKMDLALTACGYALIQFQKMAKQFQDEHDPVKCLEKEKSHYLQFFCDFYMQTAQEIIAARHCCHVVERAVERKVRQQMCVTVIERMENDKINSFLFTKPKLIRKVLASIGIELEKSKFKTCSHYLRHPSETIQDYVKEFTMEYCESGRTTTRLTEYAKDILDKQMDYVDKAVTETSKKRRRGFVILDWIDEFKRELSKELIIDYTIKCELGPKQEKHKIDVFTAELNKGIDGIKEILAKRLEFTSKDMESWDQKPYDLIYQRVSGCPKACPFCREPCNNTNKVHDGNHTVSLHRPMCLGGWRIRSTGKMMLETCTEAVTKDYVFYIRHDADETCPYRQCEKIYPNWKIQEGLAGETSLFWKYVVAHFKSELARLYNMEEDSVPEHWMNFELSQAIEAL